MLSVYKKELLQYFTSMIGFVFLAFFLCIIGIYTWTVNIAGGSGNFETTLNSVKFLFVILIPVLTMRIMSEENKQKTDQLLYTSPISIAKIIIGKYLAVLTIYAMAFIPICIYPLIINHYGDDVRLSTAYSAVIGFFLLGAAYIAIGVFISSMTESQLIAAIVSLIVMLITFLMPQLTQMIPASGKNQVIIIAVLWLLLCMIAYATMKNVILSVVLAVGGEGVFWILYALKPSMFDSLLTNILNAVSISDRFNDFTLGLLDYSAIVYYVSIAVLFVFLTIQLIKRKRFD